jgi:hypothetical protein
MTILDWVLLIVWLGLTLGGFWKGAVRLIFGGGGLVAGLWLAVVAGDDAQAAIEGVMGIPWLSAVLGRLLLVLLCGGLALLAGWGIERTLTAMRLGWLVVVAIQFSPELAALCRESQVAQYLLWVSEAMLGAVETL